MTIKETNKIEDPWERARKLYDDGKLSDEEFVRKAKTDWKGVGSPVGAALIYIDLLKGKHPWQK